AVVAAQSRRRDARNNLQLSLPVLLDARRIRPVVLLFVVAPPADARTPVADIVVPPGRIDGAARGTVEFVAPHPHPHRRRRWRKRWRRRHGTRRACKHRAHRDCGYAVMANRWHRGYKRAARRHSAAMTACPAGVGWTPSAAQ